MKACTKCKEVKETNGFHRSGRNKSGLASWCKDCVEQNKQKWRTEKREKYLFSTKAYNQKRRSNPVLHEKDKKKSRMYGYTIQGRYMHVKAGAKSRGIEFKLTKEEFKTFWKKNCNYCGELIEGVGIDRVENSKGYSKENCVPCCIICNKMKMAMEIPQFINRCRMILANRNLINAP